MMTTGVAGLSNSLRTGAALQLSTIPPKNSEKT
jgi:hypothetical protein